MARNGTVGLPALMGYVTVARGWLWLHPGWAVPRKGVWHMFDLRRTEGFTLIEATVVLSVIAIMTMVLVPTITGYISEARMATAHSEVQTIAGAIESFYSNTMFFPKTVDSLNGRLGLQTVDLLVSQGSIPRAPVGPVLNQQGVPVSVDVSGWVTGTYDLLENHLIRNRPGYQNKGGPNEFGWNGPYHPTTEIPADPWGNRYMVNVRFLDPSAGVLDATGHVKTAVIVISAGPDGIIQTPFIQPTTTREKFGDDIAFAIQ